MVGIEPEDDAVCFMMSYLSLPLKLGKGPATRRTLVIIRLVLIGPKDLDGREASDTVLTAQGLVLVGVHCTDLNDALRGGGGNSERLQSMSPPSSLLLPEIVIASLISIAHSALVISICFVPERDTPRT